MVKTCLISLLFKDECQVPVGENSSFWSRKIYEVVKHHYDLHYDHWGMVPASVKRMLKALVMDNFKLDLLRKSHKSGLELQLKKCYSRTRSNLYKDAYQIHFEGVDMKDSVVVANAKVEARANVPKGGVCPE